MPQPQKKEKLIKCVARVGLSLEARVRGQTKKNGTLRSVMPSHSVDSQCKWKQPSDSRLKGWINLCPIGVLALKETPPVTEAQNGTHCFHEFSCNPPTLTCSQRSVVLNFNTSSTPRNRKIESIAKKSSCTDKNKLKCAALCRQ